MADYKDILTGTINVLIEKAKGVVDSTPVRSTYESNAGRAKAAARIAKLTLESNGQTEELKRAYTEIGKVFYDLNSANPEGFFVPLFEKVEELRKVIKEKDEEIEALKAEFFPSTEPVADETSDVEVEIYDEAAVVENFEEVVADTETENT